MIYFVDGQFLPPEKAVVPINDLSVQRGFGVFEFFVTKDRVPVFLEPHIERLFFSAKELGIPVGYTPKEIEQIVFTLIEKNPGMECGIRIVLTGGTSLDGFLPNGKTRLTAIVERHSPLPNEVIEVGVSVQTTSLSRSLPHIKTIDYTPGVLACAKAKREGFFDCLYMDREKNVLECSRSNFFGIRDGEIITPKENILHGITRSVLIENFPVAQRTIPYNELESLDEVFMTSSTKDILPICQIDQISFGPAGDKTKELMNLFENILQTC